MKRRSGDVEILVVNLNRGLNVNVSLLKRLVQRVVESESDLKLGALEISLVDDATISRTNEEFLGHTGPTDVISFLYAADAVGGARGELIISTERATAQAVEWGSTVAKELALYVVHGILHLNGYKDGSAIQRREMRRREKQVMSLLALEFEIEKLQRVNRREGR